MAEEPTGSATHSTLVEELAKRARLSWYYVSGATAIGLVLFAVGAAYLDGVLPAQSSYELWRAGLTAPVLIAYVLMLQPTLKRLRESAIEAFRPLVSLDDGSFHRTLAEASLFNRRLECLAAGLGVACGLLVDRPWDPQGLYWAWGSGWLVLYGVVSAVMLWGLLGWFAYSALSSTRLFSRLRPHVGELNVFDVKFLEPIGRWSLGIALVFMGGNAVGLLFVPWSSLSVEIVVLYIALILVPVLVFFLNMWSTHEVIVEAKERELKTVSEGLASAAQRLKMESTQSGLEEKAPPPPAFDSWVAVENRLKKVPEWPYTQSILRGLVASMLVPVLVFLLQHVVFEVLLNWLPL
jgi:hypothetical protein